MKFNNEADIAKNLHQSMFYSPKLKKAIYLQSQGKGLKIDVWAASDNGFDKKIHTLDATKEFHLTCATSGFTPRLFQGVLISAERRPNRQWHHGWNSQNTDVLYMRLNKEGDDVTVRSIRFTREWLTDNGFLGSLWTGGFRSYKAIVDEGVGALSPTLAILGKKVVNLSDVIGEVSGSDVKLYSDYYSSFLVRELQDLGVKNVMEIPNAN